MAENLKQTVKAYYTMAGGICKRLEEIVGKGAGERRGWERV